MLKAGKISVFVTAFIVLISFAGLSFAADRYVRLRSVEGEVAVYSSGGTEEATINTPLMDGDEVQTGDGRAELSFSNGIVVRIGDYSAVRVESAYTPMSIDLVQGTVFVDSHIIDRFNDELVLRAGDADVFLIDEGNIRVDLGSEGAVRVTSVEGQAEVEARGRRVLLNAGERTYVDPGNEPSEPEISRGDLDELDEWNQSRMDYYARGDFGGGYYDDYVDQDIYYDAYDLGGYGDWRNMGSYGYVWVPHVEYGWRPYYDGRWSYYNNSWFWVSYEPWGWAPYHYGRWGWSLDFGWYWIPGNVFGPSWVSWYSYGNYVGWCPLNYYNYPIFYHDNFYRYPAIQKQKTLNASNSWTFVKKDDLGVRNIKKAVLDESHIRNIKIDRAKTSINPKRDLVSYVIPKTKQGPAWVNDKRIIKQPGDIKNPIGTKHREEQFERPGGKLKGGPVNTDKGKSAERSFDRPSKGPVKVQPSKPAPKERESFNKPVPKDKDSFNRGKAPDRDSQFKRKESSKQYSSPYSNPYYKSGRRTYDEKDSSTKTNPWSRRPTDQSYERPKEVNPRYRDEAKKYFERFEHKNRGSDVERSAPRSYEPPQRNYEPPRRNYEPPKRSYEAPKRSYEAPKREYKAPDRKSDYSNRSSQNNNRKPSGSSSNSNNNRKRNN